MVVLRVKDRGRDIAVHQFDSYEEAEDIRRVYELLGYAPERLILEQPPQEERAAA